MEKSIHNKFASHDDTKTCTSYKNELFVLPDDEFKELDKNSLIEFYHNKFDEIGCFESTEEIEKNASHMSDQPESKDEIPQVTLQEDIIVHKQTHNGVKPSPCTDQLDDFARACTNAVYPNPIVDTLKTRFYEYIDDNNDKDCHSLLQNNLLTNTSSLLALGLKKAVKSGNTKIVSIILSTIEKKSSKILTEFRDQYKETLKDSKVWMGTECSCSKMDEQKYADEKCENPKPILIVESDDEFRTIEVEEKFQGFLIKVVTENTFRMNESRMIEQKIIPDTEQRLNRVPKSVAKRLFKKHSNLTMVCPSAYKSKGFGTNEFVTEKIDCINLFCRRKGIIPIGEHHFPLEINDMPTNVLEGTSYLTSAVHIGDKIYNSNQEIGTLGGFVKYYGIDTFLTCAHVIFGKSNIGDLKTRDIHFNCHTIRNDNDEEPVKCTLIRHILKYDTEESNMEEDGMESAESEEETSIDAALVFIQMPNTSHDSIGNCSPIPDSTTSCAKQSVELRIKLQGYGDSTDNNLSALGSIY